MKQKKAKLYWYKKIAATIREMYTIEMDRNEKEYPTIHWMIAEYMLKDYKGYDIHRNLDYYTQKIQKNYRHAINYLWKQGVQVYVYIEKGSKNIQCITLDPLHNKARERNCENICSRVHMAVNTGIKQVRYVAPEKLPELLSVTKKMLGQ